MFKSESWESVLKCCNEGFTETRCIHSWLTLLMTASLASISNILNQIPMFSALKLKIVLIENFLLWEFLKKTDASRADTSPHISRLSSHLLPVLSYTWHLSYILHLTPHVLHSYNSHLTSHLSATALLVSQTNFLASSLISTQLLRRANRGARGKAATKMVMKPNWRTEGKERSDW